MALRLGFDIDEVLARSLGCLGALVKEKYGVDIDPYKVSEPFLALGTYVDDPELNKAIIKDLEAWICDKDIQYDIGVYEDAAKYIRRFKKAGHKIYFITARPKENEVLTVKWLRKHGIPFDGVFVIGNASKGAVAKKLKLDAFVDDMIHNLENIHLYKKRWGVGLILLSRPWNKGLIDKSKFIRIDNWEEFDRLLGIRKR